jgi:hypothetical protein
MIEIKKPELFKVLSISTEHITEADGKKLNRGMNIDASGQYVQDHGGNDEPIIYDYGEGAFVYCSEDPQFFPDFSKEFNDIIEFGRKQGYRYICFDCDGAVYEELPTFDW